MDHVQSKMKMGSCLIPTRVGHIQERCRRAMQRYIINFFYHITKHCYCEYKINFFKRGSAYAFLGSVVGGGGSGGGGGGRREARETVIQFFLFILIYFFSNSIK